MPRMYLASTREFTDKEKNYWAFRPVKSPAIPKVADAARVVSPIDPFVQSRLKAAGLRPSPRADRLP